ncbi:MAG: flippase-like domain-containing protein [Melioribacteraceae bacterium]|nr:flippase-like domain-containing protein [Melioribacteraceae bacterium]
MSDKIKKYIFISIIITVIVYLALSFYGNINLVLVSLKAFQWIYFPIILIIIYLTFLLKFLKWQYYLKYLDVKVQLGLSFKIFMASLIMSITPGKIGDLIKSYMLKETNGTPVNTTIPIVFAERVTEFAALLFLVILGINIYNQSIVIIIISLFSIIILILLLFNSRIMNKIIIILSRSKKLEKYIEPISLTISNSKILLKPKPFSLMILLSLFIWIVECFAFYLILIQFNIDFQIIWSFFTYLFSIFIGSLSMLPAGLGVTDGSLTFLLSQNGLSKEIAVTATLIVRIATLWFALIVGVIGMIGFNRVKKNEK